MKNALLAISKKIDFGFKIETPVVKGRTDWKYLYSYVSEEVYYPGIHSKPKINKHVAFLLMTLLNNLKALWNDLKALSNLLKWNVFHVDFQWPEKILIQCNVNPDKITSWYNMPRHLFKRTDI